MYMIFEILIKVSISLGVIMTCHYLFNNVMNAFSEKKVIDVLSQKNNIQTYLTKYMAIQKTTKNNYNKINN